MSPACIKDAFSSILWDGLGQLHPAPFPVPVTICLHHRTSEEKSSQSDSCHLPEFVTSDCSLVQCCVSVHRTRHVSHRRFLTNWKSGAAVMNWLVEKRLSEGFRVHALQVMI